MESGVAAAAESVIVAEGRGGPGFMSGSEAYRNIRDVLEILYFVSGIALVLIAAKGLGQIKVGLQQIKLTKEIAEKSARRDAYRLAHEQCQSFGTSVAIAVSNVLAQARALGVTIYTNPSFQVEECQIVKHDFQGNAILAALSRLDPTVPMNMLEASQCSL
jgi:hypothetical protein